MKAEILAVITAHDHMVAASLGYTVKKIGRYHTLKEMDSIRIYNRTNWFRWSREHEKGNNGGSQIDFLRVFAGHLKAFPSQSEIPLMLAKRVFPCTSFPLKTMLWCLFSS